MGKEDLKSYKEFMKIIKNINLKETKISTILLIIKIKICLDKMKRE